jgi:hypothetical protein
MRVVRAEGVLPAGFEHQECGDPRPLDADFASPKTLAEPVLFSTDPLLDAGY